MADQAETEQENLDGKWGDIPTAYFKSGVCVGCVHKHSGKNACDAFLNGIPLEIARGDNDHSQPFVGDGGIQFKAKEE